MKVFKKKIKFVRSIMTHYINFQQNIPMLCEDNMMNDFTVVYRILNAFQKAMDQESFDPELISANRLKVSENRRNKLLIQLIKNDYIENIDIKQYVDEESPDIIIHPSATITLKGLEYLESNGMMKRAAAIFKELKEFIPIP